MQRTEYERDVLRQRRSMSTGKHDCEAKHEHSLMSKLEHGRTAEHESLLPNWIHNLARRMRLEFDVVQSTNLSPIAIISGSAMTSKGQPRQLNATCCIERHKGFTLDTLQDDDNRRKP